MGDTNHGVRDPIHGVPAMEWKVRACAAMRANTRENPAFSWGWNA
jgi:hypothetical protein